MRLGQVRDILATKFAKRGIPVKACCNTKMKSRPGGSMIRQQGELVQGISKEFAKDLVKQIKGLKLKVQAKIQEEQVARELEEQRRVAGSDRNGKGK